MALIISLETVKPEMEEENMNTFFKKGAFCAVFVLCIQSVYAKPYIQNQTQIISENLDSVCERGRAVGVRSIRLPRRR